MVDTNGPTPQFINSLNAALEYFKRLEATGDIAQLDRERQNINQVIELGLSRPETCIPALEALIGSFQLLYARGYWREGMETFARALQVCPEDRPDLKVELLGRYGELQRISGHLSAAVTAHEAELALAQELDDPLLTGRAHARLVQIFRERQHFEQAEVHGRAALTELSKVGEKGLDLTAQVLSGLGRIARRQGNYDQALDYLHKSVAMRRQLNNEFYLVEGLHELGMVYQETGQYAEALRCYQEAGQLLEGTEQAMERIRLQLDTGVLHFNQQNYELAETMFRAVDLDYLRQTGHLDQEARILTNIGNAILYQERFSEAADLFNRAIDLWSQQEKTLDLANAEGSLGEALAGMGDATKAANHLQNALTLLKPFSGIPRGKRLIALFTEELNKLEKVNKP